MIGIEDQCVGLASKDRVGSQAGLTAAGDGAVGCECKGKCLCCAWPGAPVYSCRHAYTGPEGRTLTRTRDSPPLHLTAVNRCLGAAFLPAIL